MEEKSISGCDSSLTTDENCDLTSENEPFPLRLSFTSIYCLMFGIAAVGNLTVFIALSRRRHQTSRISLMMRHLTVADLLVTILTMPFEVSWLLADQWMSENLACNFFLFLQAYGLYLSRNIVICVSLDGYLAIYHPRNTSDALRRGRIMLSLAWISCLIYALPQSFIMHTSPDPMYLKFRACQKFGTYVDRAAEIVDKVYCVAAIHFIPITIVCYTCTRILCRVDRNIRQNPEEIGIPEGDQTSDNLISTIQTSRLSKISTVRRAKDTTAHVTMAIVVASMICWTPHAVMTLWFMFDRESSLRDEKWLRECSFMLAMGNSCLNPMICGSYIFDFRRERMTCFYSLSRAPEDIEEFELTPLSAQRSDASGEELFELRSPIKKVRFECEDNQTTSFMPIQSSYFDRENYI